MPLTINIPSFGGGEYSPEMYSRVDIQRYAIGLRTCRNFLVHPQGGASNRPGTKYVAQAKYADKKCRVVRFVFNTSQAYILEFGEHYVRFYTDQLPIDANVPDEWSSTINYAAGDFATYSSATYFALLDSLSKNPATETSYWAEQTVYEVITPYTEDDLSGLRFESSADVLYITHPDYQTRTLSRYADAVWLLELYQPDDGPFMADNLTDTELSVDALTGTTTLNASAALFDALHVGALFKLKHYIASQTVSSAFSGTGTSTSISCFTTWRVISHGTWTGKFKIEKSNDGGSTWTALRSFTSADDANVNTYGTEDIENNPEPFLLRLNMYDYTSGTANIDLTTDPFYQQGVVRVSAVNSSTDATVTIVSPVGSTDSTVEWAEGSWSDYRGWPSVARFFQDRLCFSSTYSEPMTTWMSQISNYVSFKRNTTLLDTDGISVNLPSRQLNAINGLLALRKLCAFTSASEWTIGPVSGNALTPKTVEQLAQGYRGSYGVDPAIVGNQAIFVQANGKAIRDLSYNLGDDGYTGSNLNVLANHLFYKYRIIEIAYQQDPDSIVWCLRDDGVLLGLTYMKEQDVIAWSRHDTGSVSGNPQGYFESITTIPGDGFDELWMVVRRGSYRFIERMTKRLVESECTSGLRQQRIEDSFHVDCGVTFGETPLRITQIQLSDPIVVTAPLHGLSNGDTIKLKNITEEDASTLNGTSWTIGNVDTNTFELTTEV